MWALDISHVTQAVYLSGKLLMFLNLPEQNAHLLCTPYPNPVPRCLIRGFLFNIFFLVLV